MIYYNACINACEKSQQWQLALRLPQEKRSQCISANVSSYNACICAYEKSPQSLAWPQVAQLGMAEGRAEAGVAAGRGIGHGRGSCRG